MAPFSDSRISFPFILKLIFVLMLGVCILAYVLFQARNLLLGPSITLSHEISPIQHERTILLEGTTKNIVSMYMNGKEIHTDEKGVFSQRLVLENGYTIMTLHAQDRYGRTSTLTRQFVYTPS